MSVYVGKDVTITVQIPVEEDISSQANGSQTVFTVSKTPISDRDLDGVVDEPEHVTAYVDGSEVTVSSVDDDQGQVTLASAPSQGSRVVVEYRYDLAPNIAQELSIEPKQKIEGIDGLGSDVVQTWAVSLKEITGSIKEAFKVGSLDQWNRIFGSKHESLYSQQFWTSTALNDFQGDTGNFTVDNQQLLQTSDHGMLGVKNTVLPMFRDGIIRCRQKKVSGGDGGYLFRWNGGNYNYYRVYFDSQKRLHVDRVKDGETVNLFLSSALSLPSDFFPVEIKFVENKITVDVNNGTVFNMDDSDPLLISGMPGFYGYFNQNERWDDFQVWTETSPREYGMIVSWNQGGSAVKIGMDKVVFPEGSIPSPKNQPVFIVTPFKAQTIKTIS